MRRPLPIAIVGLACRLPGQADRADRLWEFLASGQDAVAPIPPERWDHDLWYDPDPAAPGKTRQREAGMLQDIDRFDAAQFGISPREAEAMDPQQRILLETVWQALEDAGELGHPTHRGRVGVFVGLYNDNYGLTGRGSPDPSLIGGWSASGTHTSIAAGRIAFTFDFTGPAISVDTACSSSLVAVHLALQSLRAGECDMAIAAGVHLLLSPQGLVASSKLGATSPSSRCRPFDASADGFGHAEGCGVVVLRRASEALRPRALILGSAVNQDGRSAGLTAPSGPAQEAVLRTALKDAGLAPGEVDAIEAHGTGTALGDPIEMHALASVFAGRDRPLWVGSVKSNIGHAEAAAGVAGLIKAVLMVEQAAIPPSLHFTQLNPHIELDGVDIRVPTAPQRQPLRAVGVSSFGFSGTNAHVLVGPAPKAEAAPLARPVSLLPLAARTETALEALRQAYLDRLDQGADWPALAHTGALRQAKLPWRLAVTASDAQAARQALAAAPVAKVGSRPKLGFLVTGQGSAYPGMALGLLPGAPVLRDVLKRCDAVMDLPRPLEEIFQDGAALGQTEYAQPALFALAVGLGEQLKAWGITPDALLGHSVGEYAAVVLAGVLPLEDGARLIARRARLMQALPAGGGMAAVLGARVQALSLLQSHPELEVAAWNAPAAITVAGPLPAIERLANDPRAERLGLAVHVLPVSHAFHSRLLEPMLQELEQAADLPHGAPQVPVVGNLTGKPHTSWNGRYWRDHARSPVQFEAGLESLQELGCDLLVELGPQPVLSGFARHLLPGLPTLARGKEPWAVLLETLQQLHQKGLDPDWAQVDRPFHLPTTQAPHYPFERQSYWLDDPTLVRGQPSAQPSRPAEAVGDEKVWGFYDQLAEIARTYQEQPDGHVDGHLTFGLLDAPEPGFSWIRVLFEGAAAGDRHDLLTRSHRAIKELAFETVDLSAIRRVMDFGCGHGADLITLASRAPHLELHGFTISARQVAIGRERAKARGLSSRVHIHHGDSAKNPFPGRFDLIFGFEVAGLIADKAALFANIGSHLNPGGTMVMADFVADGDRIAALDTASFTPTPADWAELFAGQRLRITDCVDTSAEVANFLDDPGFADEVDRLVARYGFSELTRRHLLSNHNIMHALRRGLMRYLILAARHEPATRPERLRAANEAILRTRAAVPASPDAGWFYRAEWRPRRVEQVARERAAELDRHAAAAEALDAMAHGFLAAADLATATPAPAYRALHAHLLKSAQDGQPPAQTVEPPDLPEAVLLAQCGPHLRAVVEGRQDPLELLFPGGDLAASTALYRDSPFTGAANAIAAEAFAELLAGRGPARIIEVGAGTGGTTQALQDRLRPGDHYLFTDISPAFVTAGTRRFGLEGRPFDLERPLDEQSMEPGGFDIVVAANVLHATADLAATLGRVARLLRPDGALLLVENGRPMLWGDLTFGLTEGMWRFADHALRPDYALLPEPAWRQALAQAGFTVEAFAAGTEATAAASGLVVYQARRTAARIIRTSGDGIEGATDIVDTQALEVREAGQVQGLVEHVLDLARTAVAMPVPPRLWLVASRARAAEPGERTTPAQAVLFGVANSLALEHPELRVTVVDTDDPPRVRQVVEQGSPETRLAIRRGRTSVLRLASRPAPAAPATLRADATYLIVGGLGGVGQQVARDLAAAGARHLVLAGPTPRAVEIQGAAIEVVRCNAAEPADVEALMQRAAICDPPVRGIFHVAGTLDDAVLAGQGGERIARVLAPKVTGADLLDRLSRNLPLDHFVLFSSSAALIGSAAQANHAAANAFLDSLAERRRAEGLPGLSVAWGAWGEVGAAAKVGEEVARRGLRPMPPAAAAAALRRAMAGDQPTLGIMDVDWATFCARYGAQVPPFLDEVRPRQAQARTMAAAPAMTAAPASDLGRLPPEQRFDGLVRAVRATAARILGLPGAEAVAADAPLRDLGLDSLMTVELRNALATLASAKLPATLVFDHPTCAELARHLAEGPMATTVPAPAERTDGFDELDTDELAALLEQELAAAGRHLDEAVG